MNYDVFDRGVLAATAATTLVTFDFLSERPRRLTPDEKAMLAGYTDDSRVAISTATSANA
jgi:acyl-CoA thioester hydrolase